MRKKRTDGISRYIAPLPRFTAGMLMLPPFLLTAGLVPKLLLTVFFALLALSAGKRLRWGYYLIVILSVTFFHLLAPWGRVLLMIGPFPVTSGALENGLTRGITLAGMVLLSAASVKPGLELPGRFGGLLGRTFYYFDSIIEGKEHLSRRNFFSSLDVLLSERFNAALDDFGGHGMERYSSPVSGPLFRGWVPASAALLIPWGLWLWTMISSGSG